MPRKPNPYKKQPHEMNELERLRQQVRKVGNLEKHVEGLKSEVAWHRNKWAEAADTASKYNWLRRQELMVMTPEGVKYLKEEDLDEYVDKHYPRFGKLDELAHELSKAMELGILSKTPLVSNEFDSYVYQAEQRILYGNDAGKES